MESLQRGVRQSFKIFCFWIARYDNDYAKFNNFHLGAFKRLHPNDYNCLVKFYHQEITTENLTRFVIFIYSKLKPSDLTLNTLKILNQLISKKFCIGNRTANENEARHLTELKNEFLIKKSKMSSKS